MVPSRVTPLSFTLRRTRTTPLLLDEERPVLAAANPRLDRLIVATVETGCRLGELVLLRWREVNLKRREIRLLVPNTKDDEDRMLPILSGLLGVLEMARTGPSGQVFAPDAHVFGDAVGRRVKSVKKAWKTAVLKAHGHTPTWVGGLSPESRDRYRWIHLHFHDLRHEAGSRLLELGWPLHHVKEMLGHADIKTTNTSPNMTRNSLQESMRVSSSGGRLRPARRRRSATGGSPSSRRHR